MKLVQHPNVVRLYEVSINCPVHHPEKLMVYWEDGVGASNLAMTRF